MKVYYRLEDLPEWKYPVLTQGTFDGVHIGHRELIAKINKLAKEEGGESILLTYFPHPRIVLNPRDNSLRLLNTLEEKIRLLEEAGIQNLIVLEFNASLAGLSAKHFIEKVLVEAIGVKKLVVGYDHRFGKNRAGNVSDLVEAAKKFEFSVEQIPAQTLEDIAISSTKIRRALHNGEVETATELLGNDFSLSGVVVEGKKLGRELGFPTANIKVEEEYKLIPKEGVYYVKVELGGLTYNGMLSIGTNPTVEGGEKKIEVHILGLDKNIYGQTLRITFKKWIRNTEKFVSLQHLKEQLNKDKQYVEQNFI